MNANGVFDPGEGSDDLAKKEALNLASGGNLKTDADKREHNRHQTFRDHVNWATLILFWLVIVCVAVGVLSFSVHLVLPSCWHYLTDRQLGDLRSILGTAILSSALTGYAARRMA